VKRFLILSASGTFDLELPLGWIRLKTYEMRHFFPLYFGLTLLFPSPPASTVFVFALKKNFLMSLFYSLWLAGEKVGSVSMTFMQSIIIYLWPLPRKHTHAQRCTYKCMVYTFKLTYETNHQH